MPATLTNATKTPNTPSYLKRETNHFLRRENNGKIVLAEGITLSNQTKS